MDIDSARELKAQLIRKHLQPLLASKAKMSALGIPARAVAELIKESGCDLGFVPELREDGDGPSVTRTLLGAKPRRDNQLVVIARVAAR